MSYEKDNHVLAHTDLSRTRGESLGIPLDRVNWGNYDLVVIDESHNFRNNTRGRRDEDGNIIAKSRYERLMDDIVRVDGRDAALAQAAKHVAFPGGDAPGERDFEHDFDDDRLLPIADRRAARAKLGGL